MSRTTKFRDLGKQRERLPCSLKVEISTNCPANLIPTNFPTQTLFQTQNPRDVRDASRTTKARDLGKQCERSLCSRKNQISTNYPDNLIPTNSFQPLHVPRYRKNIGKAQENPQNSNQPKQIPFGHYMYPGTTRTQVRCVKNKLSPLPR